MATYVRIHPDDDTEFTVRVIDESARDGKPFVVISLGGAELFPTAKALDNLEQAVKAAKVSLREAVIAQWNAEHGIEAVA